MKDDTIDYGKLIDKAMRSIVRETLLLVQKDGLPAEHHFYVTFYTDFPGVEIDASLRKEYEEEMTIVLQHQFWDLEVTHEKFSVVLSFNHKKQKLTIPFEAITAFADPSVKFGLQFRQMEEELAGAAGTDGDKFEDGAEDTDTAGIKAIAQVGGQDNVVSLDSFRKK